MKNEPFKPRDVREWARKLRAALAGIRFGTYAELRSAVRVALEPRGYDDTFIGAVTYEIRDVAIGRAVYIGAP